MPYVQGYPQRPEDNTEFSGSRVRGICGVSGMNVRNQTQVL